MFYYLEKTTGPQITTRLRESYAVASSLGIVRRRRSFDIWLKEFAVLGIVWTGEVVDIAHGVNEDLYFVWWEKGKVILWKELSFNSTLVQ